MRSTRRRDPPPGYILFDRKKYLESSDDDDGDAFDVDVNDVELFHMLLKNDVVNEKKLDEYFIYDDKLSENNKCFLKEFFRKKIWICKEVDGLDDIDLLLEDEIDMLKQECYEAAHSLRKRERENILAKAEIERIEEVKRLKEDGTQNADERKQSKKQRKYLRLHEVMFRPPRRLAYNMFNLRK
ncbi:hypothetical protein Tco_1190694 [Tanacetum coccineum]